MKRRISVEQLQELTTKQQDSLRELWQPEEHDVFLFGDRDIYGCILNCFPHESTILSYSKCNGTIRDIEQRILRKIETLPLLSVSQMIELLESKDHFFAIGKEIACDDLGCLNWGWLIEINTKESPHQIEYMEFSTDELADCLWKAVKTIL
jgi:hypothetical protein